MILSKYILSKYILSKSGSDKMTILTKYILSKSCDSWHLESHKLHEYAVNMANFMENKFAKKCKNDHSY